MQVRAPHVTPHPPQLGSALGSTQLPPQQIDPSGHPAPPPHVCSRQIAFTHDDPIAHVTPQPPQLRSSLVTSLQPDVQHVVPAGHAGPPLHDSGAHCPATHDSRRVQALPQLPQLSRSSFTCTQTAAQHVSPAPHGAPPQFGAHVLATHVAFAMHAAPHAPQLLASRVVSVHAPPQHVFPAGQVPSGLHASRHAPFWQPDGQRAPHAPQLLASSLVPVSQPFCALPSQSAKPGLHAPTPHVPDWHPAIACRGTAQTWLHAPQLATSVDSSTQLVPQQVVRFVHAWSPHVAASAPPSGGRTISSERSDRPHARRTNAGTKPTARLAFDDTPVRLECMGDSSSTRPDANVRERGRARRGASVGERRHEGSDD
jgi:hypothetical protein